MSPLNFFIDVLEEEEEDQTTIYVVVAVAEQLNRSRNLDFVSLHDGSIVNHRVINRNRAEGSYQLYRDYFADSPTYPEHIFCKRFRMRHSLFIRIQEAIESHDPYSTQRVDAVGIPGLSSLQKIPAALRMLAYGVVADTVDEYLRLGESTTIESLKRFVKSVVEIFGDVYLRRPNSIDIARLMAVAERSGFPGMLGSIDCMHWKWKNCPIAWRVPRSLDNINELDRSHLFSELAKGHGPEVKFTINGREYNLGYYLTDGIYPSWPTFVKTIPSHQGNKMKFFAAAQEITRKDVERAFGVLQARFAIVRGPSRFWDAETLKYIMIACIVMHNMIVEDERDINHLDLNCDAVDETPTISISHNQTNELLEFIQVHRQTRD